MLLGRKPVWPIQLEEGEVDLSGTDLTGPLVDALANIHNAAFGKACVTIKKEQERYARASPAFNSYYPLVILTP